MVAFIAMEVGRNYLMQYLEIKWRTWLVDDFVRRWLSGRTYYLMQIDEELSVEGKSAVDNPDQRITDDVRLFVSYFLNLTLGIFNAALRISSFGAVLWGLSGVLDIPLFGETFALPGYMVWLAIAYALLGTGATLWAGRPIVRLSNRQQEYEADLRFGLARLREHFESIAFYGGEQRETVGALDRFNDVRRNFFSLMLHRVQLTWVTELHWRIGFLFPYMVAVPRIFAGEMQFGGLMQTAVAFQQVVNSLSFLVIRYYSPTEASIAQFQTVVHRLTDFRNHMEQVERTMSASDVQHTKNGNVLAVDGLTVCQPDGRVLTHQLSFTLARGEHLFIEGASGIGKSTLLRAIAGIWPYGSGTITMPKNANMLFLPQKSYLPMGTLRAALLYPAAVSAADTPVIENALRRANLAAFISRLDQEENWAQVLSLGEQQRLAFAKALLLRPQWIFLDEATSALDEENEDRMYQLLQTECSDAAVVSIAHRRRVGAYHERKLLLSAGGGWHLE
ncbi:ABC transporter ATP-binding protein/permease [Selenomonas infelix]